MPRGVPLLVARVASPLVLVALPWAPYAGANV
ncbi:hypothetical protein HEB94_003295 [Actinopolymorpha pittospori]|uniref:Uncharacterized protein n=1 Tax=Actinopolymorpha pittospori TaxID=648752 RepID=A0A927N011_9ACTN|nr:hypothetical protein [Actinopolymorpha pittospori]